MSGITKRLLLTLAVFFSAGVLYSAPAAAQASRTWVSGVGDDVNPCSRTAPCKTFAGAISKTATGGEINCLDPAGFGAVTITKSITIDCTGTLGGVLASSTTGIIVNGANAVVTLRGLTINGGPPSLPGVNGIRVLQAERVLVERVNIFNFLSALPNGNGIIVNPSTNPTSGATTVTVTNTTIINNAQAGILVSPAANGISVIVAVDHSTVTTNGDVNGGTGITVNTGVFTSTVKLDVTDTLVSGSLLANSSGIIVKAPSATVSGTFTGNRIINNTGFGIRITGGTFFVGTSTITGNGTGLNVAGGTLTSYGNNMLGGNTVNGSFSGTTPTS